MSILTPLIVSHYFVPAPSAPHCTETNYVYMGEQRLQRQTLHGADVFQQDIGIGMRPPGL